MGKPSRSEDYGTPEELERSTSQIQQFLKENTPKRPLKPARSDANDELQALNNSIDDNEAPYDPPECQKYLELLANSIPLETKGSGVVTDDYTESNYYKNMAAINKQHHTTGTGFIKIGEPPKGFHLFAEAYARSGPDQRYPCNPCRNDWQPAGLVVITATPSVVQLKPLRSESLDS